MPPLTSRGSCLTLPSGEGLSSVRKSSPRRCRGSCRLLEAGGSRCELTLRLPQTLRLQLGEWGLTLLLLWLVRLWLALLSFLRVGPLRGDLALLLRPRDTPLVKSVPRRVLWSKTTVRQKSSASFPPKCGHIPNSGGAMWGGAVRKKIGIRIRKHPGKL